MVRIYRNTYLCKLFLVLFLIRNHGCGVPGVWILAQGRSQSHNFLKSRSQESCQKKGLRIGRTCFHNLTEYNEIMDSA